MFWYILKTLFTNCSFDKYANILKIARNNMIILYCNTKINQKKAKKQLEPKYTICYYNYCTIITNKFKTFTNIIHSSARRFRIIRLIFRYRLIQIYSHNLQWFFIHELVYIFNDHIFTSFSFSNLISYRLLVKCRVSFHQSTKMLLG